MNEIYSKAFTEVLEVLKRIPREDLIKIPKDIVIRLEMEKNRYYNSKIENLDDIEHAMIETKIILAILYRDYWASNYEKIRIIRKLENDILKENSKEIEKTRKILKFPK